MPITCYQISTTLRHHRNKILYKISNLSNCLLLLKKIKCQYCKVKEMGDIQSTSHSHVGFLGVNKINTIYCQLSPLEDRKKLSTKYHHPGLDRLWLASSNKDLEKYRPPCRGGSLLNKHTKFKVKENL